MGDIVISLLGTCIASAIILAIAFPAFGFRLYGDENFKIIFWLSVGSTILYWAIELYLQYNMSRNFTIDRNSIFSAKEQLQTAQLGLRFGASILFIIAATIALWLLTFVMTVIDKPSNTTFSSFLITLLKMAVIATILGVSLHFISGFTTGWVRDFSRPKNTSLNLLVHSIGSITAKQQLNSI